MTSPGWPYDPIDTSQAPPVPAAEVDEFPPLVVETLEPAPPPPPRWAALAAVLGGLVLVLGVVAAGITILNRPADLSTLQRGDCLMASDEGSTKHLRKVDCAEEHTDDVVTLYDVPTQADPNSIAVQLGERCMTAAAGELAQPAPSGAQAYAFWPTLDDIAGARKAGTAKVVCTVRLAGATHKGSLLR